MSGGTLQRDVGLTGALLLGLGSILGTGVFVSLGLGAQLAGGLELDEGAVVHQIGDLAGELARLLVVIRGYGCFTVYPYVRGFIGGPDRVLGLANVAGS